MKKTELITYLKENLKIETTVSTQREYGEGEDTYVKVTTKLTLEGETISESKDGAAVLRAPY